MAIIAKQAYFISPPIVTDGLVMLLDAGDRTSYPGSGAVWNDLTSNNNSGSLINGPTFNTDNQGSIVLDGIDDYIQIANNASLNSSTCTIDIWFKYTTANNYYASLVSKHGTVGSYDGWNIYILNNTLYAQVKPASPNLGTDFTGLNITTTPWYNVTLSLISGGTSSFYINAITVDTKTTVSYTVSTQPLRIARSVDTFWSYFGGNVASLKLYNRSLSAAEVTQNYNAHKARFGLL